MRKVLDGYRETVELVVEMLEKIGQSLPRLDRYVTIFPNDSRVQEVIFTFYTEILRFYLHVRQLFKKGNSGL